MTVRRRYNLYSTVVPVAGFVVSVVLGLFVSRFLAILAFPIFVISKFYQYRIHCPRCCFRLSGMGSRWLGIEFKVPPLLAPSDCPECRRPLG